MPIVSSKDRGQEQYLYATTKGRSELSEQWPRKRCRLALEPETAEDSPAGTMHACRHFILHDERFDDFVTLSRAVLDAYVYDMNVASQKSRPCSCLTSPPLLTVIVACGPF